MPLLSSRPRQTTTTQPRSGGLFSRRRQPAVATTGRHHHGGGGLTSTHHHAAAPAPRSSRGGLFSRRKQPVVVQQRKPTMGDRFAGAMRRLRGSVTGRPGKKAAGTRRMRGTDGRGTTRRRRMW